MLYPLLLLVSLALAPQDTTTTVSARPNSAQFSQLRFVEIPGVQELSARLIARPMQPDAHARLGRSKQAAVQRRLAARRQLARFDILRDVPQTDEVVFALPAGVTEEELARALMATGNFEYVQPDWLLAPLDRTAPRQGTFQKDTPRPRPGAPVCPDDPEFDLQWHHQADRLRSCEAWSTLTGGSNVTIGICDTGLRTTHEDLLLHRREGYNAVDRLWVSEGGSINPVHYHGTRTTGVAAANGNNGLGVVGMGWNLSHRMLRVSNSGNGNAFASDLNHAARISVESGDRIASISYHGAWLAGNLPTATYVKSIGGLMLWGAGNTGSNISISDRDADDLIVVGATDINDARWSSSVYGTYVDLFAPGVNIRTTTSQSDTSYATASGTSYACPMTAGVCAMIWSARPTLSPDDVERILKASCTDLGAPGVDSFFGYGRVDLAASLAYAGTAVPTAKLSALPGSGRSPLVVQLRDLSSGIPTSWSWDFGDGVTSTLQNPVHTYVSTGFYTVSLTVGNELGANNLTLVDHVLVDVIPPVGSFEATPSTGLSPLPVSFSDTSTGGDVSAWSWDFGDGSTSPLQHPTHTYTTSGMYTVSLTVSNPYGLDTHTRTDLVAVDFIPPVAGFNGQPLAGASPLVVGFTDQSSGGAVASRSWSFADGASSMQVDPTHTYTSAGNYTVSLTLSNAYGVDTRTDVGYVQVSLGPAIVADFVGSPTTGVAPFQVDFNDLSIGNTSTWEWRFGDLTTSTDQHPTHVYTTPGTYSVTLTVRNGIGDDSTLELEKYITVL